MRLNYFSNFLLKHFPAALSQEMLLAQDNYLRRLYAGESISIVGGSAYGTISMKGGKINYAPCDDN